jgi:phenylalanyl-tRNA synthetase beta chain
VKLPLSWLSDLVDLDLSVDDLVTVMSASGLEVESVTHPGAGAAGIRVAEVLDWGPHPDADKLRVVRVTGEGGDGEIELVCGAANFDVGDKVLHALPGGRVPGVTGPDGRPGLELEAREIRGVRSEGMLASARELELGDDHAGIVVLRGDAPLGAELTDLVAVGEPVIEIAVQPDRGDHLSVLGVARDLAAILDTTWRSPAVPDPVAAASVPVTLATDRCARFATWTLEDVTVGRSPLWVRHRLAQCGVRSIDVVVDVTNLVMLELGLPLHAFDLAQLRGGRLTVRTAEGGEQLTTLDHQDRTLEPGDLVIDDAERPVSLAGVMGGRDTEVTDTTRDVLLEAAVWDPLVVRATSRRLGLVSEASQRFERRVDPEGAPRAVARAAGLLAELAGARVTGSSEVVADPVPGFAAPVRVEVDAARVRRLLDLDLDADAQAALLRRAGARVEVDGEHLDVHPPSWRGDLTRPADVAEEVARLHGYDAIPATLPSTVTTGGLTPTQRAAREARSLALAAGFHEAVTRPFVGADALVGVVPSDGRVSLANPLAKDAAAMRPSLVEGLLQAVRRNHGQGRPGTALVEFGRLFRPVDDPLGATLDAVCDGDHWRWRAPDGLELPVQPRAVAVAAQGLVLGDGWLDQELRWSVYDVLGLFDRIVARLAPPDAPGWQLERVPTRRDGLHPGRTARLELRGHEVGVVGQLHPDEADRRDLPDPVVVGELLLEPLLLAIPPEGHDPVTATTLVKHPALSVDVALVAADEVPYAHLEAAVRQGAGELLDDLWWFDEYRGEQVGEGRRSVATRLRLQAPDRQLTDEDAERVIDAVAEAAGAVGATLRR